MIVTTDQIAKLRSEAAKAGDMLQWGLCEIALEGEIDLDDYTVFEAAEARQLRGVTQEEAIMACETAIREAAVVSTVSDMHADVMRALGRTVDRGNGILTIVETALVEDPEVTVAQVVEIVCEAEAEYAACRGHESGPYEPMGISVFCDGSCRAPARAKHDEVAS